jgi:hypothetical protein
MSLEFGCMGPSLPWNHPWGDELGGKIWMNMASCTHLSFRYANLGKHSVCCNYEPHLTQHLQAPSVYQVPSTPKRWLLLSLFLLIVLFFLVESIFLLGKSSLQFPHRFVECPMFCWACPCACRACPCAPGQWAGGEEGSSACYWGMPELAWNLSMDGREKQDGRSDRVG